MRRDKRSEGEGAEAAIEAALRRVGGNLAFPPTPPLSTRVAGELRRGPRPAAMAPTGRSPIGRLVDHPRLATALLTLLVLGIVLAASPGVRRVIAERLGLPAITIQFGGEGSSPSAPSPVGADLLLGRSVDLARADELFGGGLAIPDDASGLGAPDEVYVSNDAFSPWVSFVYRVRPGFTAGERPGVGALLSQVRGVPTSGMVKKLVGEETRVDVITLDGAPAFWIEGAPHRLLYPERAADGDLREERWVGNVLIWERDGVTLRLEAEIGKGAALEIAASMRPRKAAATIGTESSRAG